MAILIRKVDRQRWLCASEEVATRYWPTNAAADWIGDLQTKGNALSVYLSNDKGEPSEDRIITAIAATRQRLQAIQYVLLDQTRIESIGLNITRSSDRGGTPDSGVNGVHCDIEDLSGSTLIKLSRVIASDGKFRELQKREVKEYLLQFLNDGFIEQDKLKPELIRDLQQ